MKNFTARGLTALATFLIGVAVSGYWIARRFQPPALPVANQPSPQNVTRLPVEAAPVPTPDSPIRSVDFGNFTYPAWPIFGDRRGKTFTLHEGELPVRLDKHGYLVEIGLSGGVDSYGDVTGDGIEEAIISFGEDNRGASAIVEAVYIYTMRHGRPAFLWGFEAGDRADGGLIRAYAENGELVVELEGKDKIIGKDLYAEDETSRGACCPTMFTRTRYEWRDGHFRQKGDAEVLPINPPK
jgi:hypothetical protein